jgi:ribosome-associated protein
LEPHERALAIARAAIERRAADVLILDMRDLTAICDFFVLCTGRSPVHVQAIAEQIQDFLKAQGGRAGHVEGRAEGRWVLLDCLSVVVHVFTEEAREYYGLEKLWGDAPSQVVADEAPGAAPSEV